MRSGHDVIRLDLADDKTARAVLALQRAAYAVEAALIGSDGIPALTETLDQLRGRDESWLGVFDPLGLSGALAWCELDDGTVEISGLVVAPRAFRQGIGTSLLDALDEAFPDRRMVVSTGSANAPAMGLYRRRGFSPIREREAAPGLLVTELERHAGAPARGETS